MPRRTMTVVTENTTNTLLTAAIKELLSEEAWNELEEILRERQISLEVITRLALRNMSQRGRHYKIGDRLRFGKYNREPLEDIIRADPDYITWCLDNMKGFTMSYEALDLMDVMLGRSPEHSISDPQDGSEDAGCEGEVLESSEETKSRVGYHWSQK